MAIFPVNTSRLDPYKSYRFLVYFGQSTTAVAAVSKVTALRRSSDVIEYREGGNNIILKGLGRTKYDPITLERGMTQDNDFITWADAAQKLDQGHPTTSLANLRREIRIELLNATAAELKRLADTAEPLYKSLDENQKRRMLVLVGGAR